MSFFQGFTAATMKWLLNLIFLAGLSVSTAQTKDLNYFELFCVTSFPTTSFVGLTNNGRVDVRLINHNGAEYMPIHSGLITMRDLDLLQKRADTLRILGSDFRFSFSLDSCRINQDGTFNCSMKEEIQIIEGKKVSVFSLSSSKTALSFSDIVIDTTRIMLGLEIDKESHFVMMDYMPE